MKSKLLAEPLWFPYGPKHRCHHGSQITEIVCSSMTCYVKINKCLKFNIQKIFEKFKLSNRQLTTLAQKLLSVKLLNQLKKASVFAQALRNLPSWKDFSFFANPDLNMKKRFESSRILIWRKISGLKINKPEIIYPNSFN